MSLLSVVFSCFVFKTNVAVDSCCCPVSNLCSVHANDAKLSHSPIAAAIVCVDVVHVNLVALGGEIRAAQYCVRAVGIVTYTNAAERVALTFSTGWTSIL
jgi:hypothetical protein